MTWQLAHETHAIERVSLTFNFSETIPVKPWLGVLDQAGVLLPSLGLSAAPDLAAPSPPIIGGPVLAQLYINIGGQGQASPIQGSVGAVPAARVFNRIVDGEAQDTVILSRGFMSFTTVSYSRWHEFVERIKKSILPSIIKVQDIVSLAYLKLEYWDRFTSDEPIDYIDYKTLLSDNSKFVPSLFREQKGLWHSHIGYFALSQSSDRLLINLNIDVIDVAGPIDADAPPGTTTSKRSVGIYSMAQDTPRADEASNVHAVMASTLGDMHTTLKLVLADAITASVADRISLHSP